MAATLHDLIAAFAGHGATPEGGVCRLTGTPEDGAARDRLAVEMGARGLSLHVDRLGNMFGLAKLMPDAREAVFVGSHLDSQPTGGRYDGAYGVLAGLLAVDAVMARAAAAPAAIRRNFGARELDQRRGRSVPAKPHRQLRLHRPDRS